MYYGSGTVDRIASGQPVNVTALRIAAGGCSGRRADAAWALSRWRLFSAWNDSIAAIFETVTSNRKSDSVEEKF